LAVEPAEEEARIISTLVSPAGTDSAGIERAAVAEEIASVAREAQDTVASALVTMTIRNNAPRSRGAFFSGIILFLLRRQSD
jgi:hypothetical protein